MRGRLLFAFYAQLFRLDSRATAVDPGYDPDFKEIALVDRDDDGIGEQPRREHAPVLLPCQVEPEATEALQLFAAGHSPDSRVRLVFHFRHLEHHGLVDPTTGDALIRVGDRLGAVLDKTGRVAFSVRTPPGLYVTESRPIGWGLSMTNPRRNLLLVTFDEREQARRFE